MPFFAPSASTTSREKLTLRDFFSAKDVFTARNLCLTGLMLALTVILSYFNISIGPSMKILRISYLPGVVVACVCGPWPAIAFGVLADTLGFIANPQGGYFPGYAISEMASCFLYALFLYRRHSLPLWRFTLNALCARVLVTVLVFFGLNFIWQRQLFGSSAAGFFSTTRLVNNLVQLPLHVVLITTVGQLAFFLDQKVFRRSIRAIGAGPDGK